MTWFDSHCHLFDCESPPDAVMQRARLAGVEEVLVAGIDLSTSRTTLQLATRPDVVAAVGVHPNSSASWSDGTADEIDALLSEDTAAAVGETGLDFYRDHSPRQVQHRAFDAHIALAKKHDRALVVHTRRSMDAALDALSSAGPPRRAVFHCWSGNEVQLQRALELGAHISFAGNVTFKNAPELRALASDVPDDRLLVETDSPYLSPEPHRGRPNEPARVALVGAAVAEARGEPVETVAELTTANARALFVAARG